jgi:thioredoxin 1
MSGDRLIHVTDTEFESQVLGSDKPVLVDFWASWCGPCLAIAPIVEQLAEDYEGKLVVAKMDIDKSPATPGKYGIRAIPTLIVFKDGQVVEQITGAVGKSIIESAVNKALS